MNRSITINKGPINAWALSNLNKDNNNTTTSKKHKLLKEKSTKSWIDGKEKYEREKEREREMASMGKG